jgi:anti-sigma factor RsiW
MPALSGGSFAWLKPTAHMLSRAAVPAQKAARRRWTGVFCGEVKLMMRSLSGWVETRLLGVAKQAAIGGVRKAVPSEALVMARA